MLGNKYLPTVTQVKLQEMQYKQHQTNLAKIKNENRRKKNLNPEFEKRDKMSVIRANNFRFVHAEKSAAVEKDNQMLLSRLIEISKKPPK